jgi:hypothetical protein
MQVRSVSEGKHEKAPISGTIREPTGVNMGGSEGCLPAWRYRRKHRRVKAIILTALLASSCLAQESTLASQTRASATNPLTATPQQSKSAEEQINVNWLYGAYVPKDVPLESLDGDQRVRLWVRSSFTTYGIYIKTALFSMSDQIRNSPPEWGDGWDGYAKRLASRQGQFVIQNSLSALGDGLVGFEPRYNRCQCNGFWARTSHAVKRNFVTYDRTETKIRPRIPLYVAAFGAGAIAGTWLPGQNWVHHGGNGAATQVGFGIVANFLGEFWPEIQRVLKRKKDAGK